MRQNDEQRKALLTEHLLNRNGQITEIRFPADLRPIEVVFVTDANVEVTLRGDHLTVLINDLDAQEAALAVELAELRDED